MIKKIDYNYLNNDNIKKKIGQINYKVVIIVIGCFKIFINLQFK